MCCTVTISEIKGEPKPSCGSYVSLPAFLSFGSPQSLALKPPTDPGSTPWPEQGAAAAAAKLLQSCPTLRDPMDCSLPGSSAHGFSRQEYWSELPLPSPRARWRQNIFPDSLCGGLIILCLLHANQTWNSGLSPRPLCRGFPTVFSPNISLCVVLFMNQALEQQQPGTAYILLACSLVFPMGQDSPTSQLTLELNLLRSTSTLHPLGVLYQYYFYFFKLCILY